MTIVTVSVSVMLTLAAGGPAAAGPARATGAAATAAAPGDPAPPATSAIPVASWTFELNRLEALLSRVAVGDEAAFMKLTTGLAALRADVEVMLRAFPPAAGATPPWLEAAAPLPDLGACAAEVGRLRAAIQRVERALQSGGDGAFYLGRVDVAVTANAPATAGAAPVPAGAAVVDAATIRTHEKVGLGDALALVPGITAARIGQRNEGSIYVRGFDIRQVPVFIDGIPVYTPYDGYADLDRFTTFDVAELRVSTGFSSVLYGANALGGAINVITRRPTGRIDGLVAASLGSGPSRRVYGDAGTQVGRWYATAGGSWLEADAYALSGAFQPVAAEDGGDRDNAYRRDAKFNGKLGVTARAGDEYALSYVGQRGRKGNPIYAGSDTAVRARYWKWPYWDKDSLYLVTRTNLGRAGYARGRVFHDTYDNALYAYDDRTFTTQTRSSSFRSLYHDDTYGGSIEWGAPIGRRQIVRAAAHVKDDRHQEHNVGEPIQRKHGRTVSVGVEDTLTVTSRLSVVAGISADWQTTSKAEHLDRGAIVHLPMGDARGLNPQVGIFAGVPWGTLRATVSRKTRLPSLKDRYSYRSGTAVPNPDLAPERATTLEAGYQGALGRRASLQASVFHSRITDLIQRFYLSPNLSQQRNIGRASASGFELDARVRPWTAVEVWGSYGFLRRENQSAPAVPLTETPRHKGLASISVEPVAAFRLSATLEFESGRRHTNDAGRVFDVPAFALVSAKATWRLRAGVEMDVSAQNLTDRNYWVADGYPEAGRSVLAGLRYRF